MIVYENNLEGFINSCNDGNIARDVYDKVILSGFNVSEKEINSWSNSLPYIANILSTDVATDLNVAIEYKFETTKNRVDFMIYGIDETGRDSIVIIELKQWSSVSSSNRINFVYAYGGNGARDYLHPSYQSYRYGCILQSFNSYVQDNNVSINTCSYLHNLDHIYEKTILNTTKYPFLNYSPTFLKDDEKKLREFIKKYIKHGKRELLYDIDDSKIKPSKNFSEMLFNAIKGKQIFTLDNEQAASVSTIIYETLYAIKHNERRTIIIKGQPGSGKSVVAINAMGQLLNSSERINTCYCTTNFTPRTVFSEYLINNDYKKSAIKNLFKTIASFSRAKEFDYDCILLDEAHRAYTWKFGQGVKRDIDMIDKLFYASRVNVFFIDEDQVVTKDDFLTIERIKHYAQIYKSEIIEGNDLCLTSQFRCVGGESYISFINSFLKYNNSVTKYKKSKYEFEVVDSPNELWEKIKKLQCIHKDARLLSGYTRDWVSKNNDENYDFIMNNGSFKMKWNKETDISFINDETQLDRIGCIHTIQGVDMSYAGVIIGKDIKYENGNVIFDKRENASTDNVSGIRNASDELAERMIRNTYKVLLTRAIYGTFVFCEDEGLNNYLKGLIAK